MRADATRREFIRDGLAAGAALGAAPLLAGPKAEKPKARMHLGLVTYMLGAKLDLPTLIDVCEKSGIEGVELRSTHKHGVEPTLDAAGRDKVRKLFEKTKVRCYALGSACQYHDTNPGRVKANITLTKRFVQLAADLGCWGVKVRPNGLPKGVPVEKTLLQIATALKECGDYAKAKDIMLFVECHGRGTSHPPHMARIMELADHPNVCICWNCNGRTDEVKGSIKPHFDLCKKWIQHLHIHNLARGYRYDELFPLLKAMHFDKFTMIEDTTRTKDLVAYLRDYRERWEKLAL